MKNLNETQQELYATICSLGNNIQGVIQALEQYEGLQSKTALGLIHQFHVVESKLTAYIRQQEAVQPKIDR